MAANGTKTEGGNAQGTVTVAVKSPAGIILRAHEFVTETEPVLGGGTREFKIARVVGEPVTVYGYAAEHGKMPRVPVVGGYALNHGVPAKLWEVWLAQNQELPLVRAGLIFAYASPRDAESHAKDGAAVRDGLEPMAPEYADEATGKIVFDPRVPRTPLGAKVATAARAA